MDDKIYKTDSEGSPIPPERPKTTCERQAQNARDLAILNRRAKRSNQEVFDVLAFQVDLFKEGDWR